MSKRPDISRAPESASEELIEHSEAAANDGVLLRELVENSDSDNITAVFAVLHTDDSASSAPNNPEKTSNRPCPNTPNETFVDILLFMDRDTLEAMQLACRFLLEFVRDREVKELPLRSISQVDLVEFYRYV
ncbi:hypothetical protein AAVH_19355 [Aphelenchoides avenae]|nr:hypothetical protein AAVH_19355 [Aphelenchus avenae]